LARIAHAAFNWNVHCETTRAVGQCQDDHRVTLHKRIHFFDILSTCEEKGAVYTGKTLGLHAWVKWNM
jgi:hypothetical protein